MRRRIQVGLVSFYLWSGSWCWLPERSPCEQCRNLYWGPFGIEVEGR